MTYTYTIYGMSSKNCHNQIEQFLSNTEGIIHANINLEKEKAFIETERAISLEKFKAILPKKYSVTQKGQKTIFKKNKYTKLKQLKPLFLILSYITITTIFLNYKQGNWSTSMLDFMGLFFLVFSFFKIIDLKGFTKSFKMYDPLSKTLPIYAWIYPFVEIILGIMFLVRFQIPIALITTLIILGITSIGVTKTLINKKSIECACLGTTLKLPMTQATLIENTIMIAMALAMLLKNT